MPFLATKRPLSCPCVVFKQFMSILEYAPFQLSWHSGREGGDPNNQRYTFTCHNELRCNICNVGVGFLVISSSSSGSSNPIPSLAAAFFSQEQSKLSNNDFDWVSPPPVSEPAFTAPSTSAPTATSSGPQPQPPPAQLVLSTIAQTVPTPAPAPAPTIVRHSQNVVARRQKIKEDMTPGAMCSPDGMMSAGALPSASPGGTLLDGGGGPGGGIGLVLGGVTGPGARRASLMSGTVVGDSLLARAGAGASDNIVEKIRTETVAEKESEKDVKGRMEVDVKEVQEGPTSAVEGDL
ncbi:hypothetical protein CPC08DRAFT_205238 [Agrocybe pediades]|nr:hypothetical protein CPC08DRAFT_205238 [Agrocybe pediades]